MIFLLVALWWAVSQLVSVRLPELGWLVAGVLILFGTVGLLGAIRSGRRAETPAPVAAEPPAEAVVETPGDLPPEMHADIVRELLSNPVERIDLSGSSGNSDPDRSTGEDPQSGPFRRQD
ncbi:hypothetical protein AB0M36_36685 [Actinoplanes sp. NPDC051346]|uniref:hypothetical protein n=1 Tax=Actinoplanes sp. NPDC051346 TaxID=3155048 RepID=UPI00341A7A8E